MYVKDMIFHGKDIMGWSYSRKGDRYCMSIRSSTEPLRSVPSPEVQGVGISGPVAFEEPPERRYFSGQELPVRRRLEHSRMTSSAYQHHQ
jgi:hypothetical protein